MNNKEHKVQKKIVNKDDISPRKKKRALMIMFSVYIFFSLIFIFLSQKMSDLWVISVIMPPMFLAVILSIFLIGNNASAKGGATIYVLKLCFVMLPLIILPIIGRNEYKSYHLKNYRALTHGVITNVTTQYSSKSGVWTYYNEFKYHINNVPKQNYSTSSDNKYKKGDSIIVAYSSKDPDFFEIDESGN